MKHDLFDLTKVFGSSFRGYWIDRDFNAWSTKRGAPYKLARTGTGACRGKYYSFYTGRYSTSMRVDEMQSKLRSNSEFTAYVRATAVTTHVSATAPSTKGYIIGSTYATGVMSFASFPKVHATEASARAECERLAKANRGTSYTYFEIKSTATAGDISWK